jgi:quercetin dioxygenase-like cupin family protein
VPGDSISIPGDNGHSLRNLTDTPTVFLVAAVTVQPATGNELVWPPGSSNPMPPGLKIEPLDVGYDNPTSTTVPARITLSRVTGVTGEFIPRSQAAGPELLVVDVGALEVHVESGQVLIRDPTDSQTEVVQTDESAATPTLLNVATTGSVLFQPGTISTVRAVSSDPVSLLVLTVLPLQG